MIDDIIQDIYGTSYFIKKRNDRHVIRKCRKGSVTAYEVTTKGCTCPQYAKILEGKVDDDACKHVKMVEGAYVYFPWDVISASIEVEYLKAREFPYSEEWSMPETLDEFQLFDVLVLSVRAPWDKCVTFSDKRVIEFKSIGETKNE